MKNSFNIIILTILLIVWGTIDLRAESIKNNLRAPASGKNAVPVNLRTDWLCNPLGIDNPTPCLSWRIDDTLYLPNAVKELTAGTYQFNVDDKHHTDNYHTGSDKEKNFNF